MIVKVYHCKNFLIDNINKKKKKYKRGNSYRKNDEISGRKAQINTRKLN